MSALDEIIRTFPDDRGITMISRPKPFEHPEELYDEQYKLGRLSDEALVREARIVVDRCVERGLDTSRPVLEVGCGTGRLTLGLAQEERITELLATDPSPKFCVIVKRKLGLLNRHNHVQVAMLTAEDLGLLPDGLFGLIVLRSTLHHILDVPAFLGACSKKLAEGGLLIFEEPCHDGYLLMGAMNQFLPVVLRSKGIELDAASLENVRGMTAAMQFYARRDVDKSQAEDKHLFRPDELMRVAARCGLELELFPNRTYAQLERLTEPCAPEYFFEFYSEYLQFCMAWDETMVALVREHMAEYFTYFHPLAAGDALPYCSGSFILKKTGSRRDL